MLRIEHLLECLTAVGCGQGAVYVSMPVSSGRREVETALRLDCEPSELRARFPDIWRQEVLAANGRDGQRIVEMARARYRERVVIDPSAITVDGWGQADYMSLWIACIDRFPVTAIASTGWEYSRGARSEIRHALDRGLAVEDAAGTPLLGREIAEALRRAESDLVKLGMSATAVAVYLTPTLLSRRPGSAEGAASRTFDWLARERSYQVAKFGLEADDAHTRAGVGADSWWDQQLTNYLGRFRLLGLEMPVGRQALAKFTATAVGLFESSVRVFGPPPAPGVSSGEIAADK